MKKLENLLNKISYGIAYLRRKNLDIRKYSLENVEIMITILILIFLLACEFFCILVAVKFQNYLMLSIYTYIWVWMISEVLVEKIFLKKFDLYLMETPKATSFIFLLVFVVTAVLSWNYFAAFVLIVISAFIHADYNKTKKKMKKGE